MSSTASESGKMHAIGPVTAHWNYRQYLEDNCIPGLFDSLVAGLILERPEDPMSYMNTKLEKVKEQGVEKISWDTFVYHLHPLRRPERQTMIQDGKTAPRQEATPIQAGEEGYQSDVFRLTEPDQ